MSGKPKKPFDLFKALEPLVDDLMNRKSDADCEKHFVDHESDYENIAKEMAKVDDENKKRAKRKKRR